MNLGFSSKLALAIGVLLPLLGVVRNWTIQDPDPGAFFADIVAGGFLLFGGWKTRQNEHSGRRFLAAAWGLTLGIFYSSLIIQLKSSDAHTEFSGTIPDEWSMAGTIFWLLIAAVGLASSLRSTRIN